MKRFECSYRGRMVSGVLIETLADLEPWIEPLTAVEVEAVAGYLEAGRKVELLDERVAEIHVDDALVLCGFPNPTKADAPQTRWKPETRDLTVEERRDLASHLPEGWEFEDELPGGKILPVTRWSIYGGER